MSLPVVTICDQTQGRALDHSLLNVCALARMIKVQIPDELKLENYEKRIQTASFDRIDLVISFRPGKDGIGATVKGFLEAIPAHDAIVKVIEEKMAEIVELKRNYHKKNRLFRNLDSAWNLTLDNPVDFYFYLDLVPKMPKITKRLEIVEDIVIKTQLQELTDRFNSLHAKCSKQSVIYETFSEARNVKDEAMKALLEAEADLNKLKQKERELALLISDDHILADEMHKSMSEVFPNIHGGFMLSRINGELIEHLPFKDAFAKVLRSKSPHFAEFLRYDYRFDPFTNNWNSLAELRDMGVCVEDPLFARVNFVNTAAQGKLRDVHQLLLRGEDPNSADLSGNTALVMAAANKHPEVVELLVNAGADVNCRDKNMMTPLLFCVNRGYMEIVRQLIDMGADRNCSDKNGRTALYYAVLSGNETVVKTFLRPTHVNEPDSLWGFTPLHLAASQGDLKLVKFLVQFGCSMYCKDKKGRTAEEVAEDTRREDVALFLQQQREEAAGQFAYRDDKCNANIWIGDQSALEVRWCADADISAVLYLRPTSEMPMRAAWLKKDEAVSFETHVIETDDDDKSTESWAKLKAVLSSILSFLTEKIKAGDCNILICDDTCDSLAPAVLVALLIVRYQLRVKDVISQAEKVRPSCRISLSLRRGLDQLQKSLDDKVLSKLGEKLRNSNVMSCAF